MGRERRRNGPFNGWSDLRLALDGATGKSGFRLAALVRIDAVVVLAVGRPRSGRSGDRALRGVHRGGVSAAT